MSVCSLHFLSRRFSSGRKTGYQIRLIPPTHCHLKGFDLLLHSNSGIRLNWVEKQTLRFFVLGCGFSLFLPSYFCFFLSRNLCNASRAAVETKGSLIPLFATFSNGVSIRGSSVAASISIARIRVLMLAAVSRSRR